MEKINYEIEYFLLEREGNVNLGTDLSSVFGNLNFM